MVSAAAGRRRRSDPLGRSAGSWFGLGGLCDIALLRHLFSARVGFAKSFIYIVIEV